ncbi:MAG: hypothetical protein P8H17_01165 [Flavobacteriales bacterium]|nr:hypothetical protein [Flavobacteriales bacterium]
MMLVSLYSFDLISDHLSFSHPKGTKLDGVFFAYLLSHNLNVGATCKAAV